MKAFLSKFSFCFVSAMLISSFSWSQATEASVQLGKNSMAQVIAEMTLEEKVKLLVGNGMRIPGVTGPVVGETQDKVPGAAGTTYAIPRLGIPSIVLADGPAGVRISPRREHDTTKTFFATGFPVGTLLASTWDTTLVKEVGKAFAHEAHEYGIDIILAPALNIHRNPLGGRNFEYYSEDPLISGMMAAAFVNGFESVGVGTSIKHFAANNQENRNTLNTIVSERALREIYLKGFEIAVKKSQPWTVMSSYNYINEKYTSEDPELLSTILRDEWGFEGLVMTDWFGGSNPVDQMKAGNDLLMPGTPDQTAKIIEAVEEGRLDEKIVDRNVARMLELILKSPTFKQYKYSDQPDLKRNAALARTSAAEGIVLLKNDNVLPLTSPTRVAVFGNASYNIVAGGSGSGDVNKAYVISLHKALQENGFKLDEPLMNRYVDYIKTQKAKLPKPRFFFELPPVIPEMQLSDDIISNLAETADVALFTLGRNSGEFSDRKLEADFYLTDVEKKNISNISQAFHQRGKKVVVVLNIGGVIETTSWTNQVDGILLAWQPGQEAGYAILDVLSGKVNPSGKIATTFPVDYNDVPSSKNFPGKEFPEKAVTTPMGMKLTPGEVVYEEGIYVGYRYFNTFNIETAYPFGYGLSYTTFSIANAKVTSSSNNYSIEMTVTNTGKVAGKEVVQLYLSAPGKTLKKPALELKAFAKTTLLQPGQSQKLTFTLTASDLASFATNRSAWITEAGRHMVKIGSSSAEIKAEVVIDVKKEIVVEKVNKVLVPKVALQEIR